MRITPKDLAILEKRLGRPVSESPWYRKIKAAGSHPDGLGRRGGAPATDENPQLRLGGESTASTSTLLPAQFIPKKEYYSTPLRKFPIGRTVVIREEDAKVNDAN